MLFLCWIRDEVTIGQVLTFAALEFPLARVTPQPGRFHLEWVHTWDEWKLLFAAAQYRVIPPPPPYEDALC